MNQSGEETLEFFGHKIPAEIKTEIDQFFNEHKYHLRSENEVTADYYEDKKDCYIVRLSLIHIYSKTSWSTSSTTSTTLQKNTA